MKINRLTRFIAILLVVTMMPLWMFGCGGGSSDIREGLVDMMVGDGKLNDKNQVTKDYVTQLDSEVAELVLYYSKEGFWLPTYLEPGSTYVGRFYENCYKLAMAWATKESEYYHSSKVMSMIKKVLEYSYENLYGEAQKASGDGNLSTTERYDQAEYLVRTLLILDEKNKLSTRKIEDYVSVVASKFPIPTGKGVDLARTSYIVLGYSVLLGDEEKITSTIATYAASVLNEVTSGSGLYADGSFIADTEIASSGSYGVIAFSEMVEIAYAVSGTKSDFAAEVPVADFLYKWGMNSIVPSLYNGRAFAGTVSSYLTDAERLGGRAVSSLLALAEIVDETKAAEIEATVKGYGDNTNSDFHKYLTTYGMCRYEDIVKDEDLTSKKVEGAYNLAAMDKLNVIGTKYSASLSLSSLRTTKYETRGNYMENTEELNLTNAVNGKGWYTGDGMLMVYTSSYAPGSVYWQYVKGTRMPGTTVDSRDRVMSNSGGYDGTTNGAGSATLGNMAVAALDFVNNNNELRSDLKAKKSWFFFDGEIVALGAGITNTIVDSKADSQSIETIVENVFYGTFTSISTSVDQEGDRILTKDKVELAPSALYIMKYGGIYVPADKNGTFKYTLSKTDGGNFVELWIDHNEVDQETGVSSPVISGKTYEYAIVPSTSMNMGEFFEYAKNPGYTVLSNTEQVQAVKDTSSGAVGYVFWGAGSCNGISTDFACTMMVLETDTQITVSISDFNHLASGTAGNITLSAGGSVVNASNGLTLNGNTITVDRNVAASGQTLTIVINK